MTIDTIEFGSCWKLLSNIDGFEGPVGQSLSTQAATGRSFQVEMKIQVNQVSIKSGERIKVRLLEDGYECWFNLPDILSNAIRIKKWEPYLFNREQIQEKLPKVMLWIEKASQHSEKYYWGGTIGPNFDCSGLVQAAFASQNIWIPRDAYQQEDFCEKIALSLDDLKNLRLGDLLFFGSRQKCTHVAIHIEKGFYWHSSGLTNGQNGIGINGLGFEQQDSISSYYKAHFRRAGRVVRCFDSG